VLIYFLIKTWTNRWSRSLDIIQPY